MQQSHFKRSQSALKRKQHQRMPAKRLASTARAKMADSRWIYNTQQGAWITVTGSNFGPTASITSLTIGGVECLYPYVTTADSKVMCTWRSDSSS